MWDNERLKEETLSGIILRSRLVGGGHRQDRELFPDHERSLPTVSTASIQTVLMIAAMEKRIVKVVDVKSAYLQAPMPKDKKDVHINLDKISADILYEIDPSFKRFQKYNWSILLKIDKALYGLIQLHQRDTTESWYNHIKGTLLKAGFIINPKDICVFHFTSKKGAQITMCIYVYDDHIATTDQGIFWLDQ